MLLEIKAREDFIEFIVCLDISWNLPKYTDCHVVELCSVVNLEIRQKIDMYRYEAYTCRQLKHWTKMLPIRAEITSNVLNDGRGWISVLNWSETKMPTPPPARWSAPGSWENERPWGEISAIAYCVSSCFSHVSVTATMSRFLDVTYLEKRDIFALIDITFIVALLILSFEPEGPGFKLTSPASRSKMAKLKDGWEGGSGRGIEHTFERGNVAVTKL